MNRITLESNWREAKRKIASLWNANPSIATTESDMPPVHVIAEKLQVQKLQVKTLLAPASPIERAVASVTAIKTPAKKKEAAKQQVEALGTWEDEGGKAAAPTSPKNPV